MKLYKIFASFLWLSTPLWSSENTSTNILVSCQSDINKNKLSNQFLSDLSFIEKILMEDHPGAHNLEDPDYIKLVRTGYENALKQVNNINSEDDYLSFLQNYLQTFHDSHVLIKPTSPKEQQSLEPKKFIFLEEGPIKESIWITLPSFYLVDDQKQKMEDIIRQLPLFRSKKMIVFDLRGNTGGNSEWGKRILSSLFTEEYAKEKLQAISKNTSVDWRISDGNIEHMKNLTQSFKKNFGEDSEIYLEFHQVYQGMLEAKAKGKFYYRQKPQEKSESKVISQDPVKAHIIVIIDHKCMSACLNFIDGIKAMNHKTLLVGETTNADTLYMEVRRLTLPSGLAEFLFPIKVYRNRQRGHNVPYFPDVEYLENLQDTEKFKSWIQSFDMK